MKSLVIGRFQPLHYGHISMINSAMRQCDEIVIGIGSSNKSRSYRNPFSYEECKFMLENSINLYLPHTIVGIPDFGNSERWIEWIADNIEFDAFISNSKLELDEFRKHDFNTIELEPRPNDYSSTIIREMIIDKKPINNMVSPVVNKFINDLDLKLRWI